MNNLLIFSIAKAMLLARWKQTLVAAIGVTFGITMFIALLSFMTGLNDLLDGLVLNRTPHVRLFNDVKPSANQPINGVLAYKNTHNFINSIKLSAARQEIYNVNMIIETIKKDSRVLGFAPKINTPVFFNDGSIDIAGVVTGIEVDAESRFYFFTK